VDGIVELGVIGCPNLGSKPAKLGEEIMPNGEGVLMVAIRGEGSYSVGSTSLTRLRLGYLLTCPAPSLLGDIRADPRPAYG
jgi:3'(2'), 5'-bisphosphate nucleotidase